MDSLEQIIQMKVKHRLPPSLFGFRSPRVEGTSESRTDFLKFPSVYSQKNRGARDREWIQPIIGYERPEQLRRQAVFQLLDNT